MCTCNSVDGLTVVVDCFMWQQPRWKDDSVRSNAADLSFPAKTCAGMRGRNSNTSRVHRKEMLKLGHRSLSRGARTCTNSVQ